MPTRDVTIDGIRYITFGECVCDNGAKYHCPHHGGYDGMGYCRPPRSWAIELLRRENEA